MPFPDLLSLDTALVLSILDTGNALVVAHDQDRKAIHTALAQNDVRTVLADNIRTDDERAAFANWTARTVIARLDCGVRAVATPGEALCIARQVLTSAWVEASTDHRVLQVLRSYGTPDLNLEALRLGVASLIRDDENLLLDEIALHQKNGDEMMADNAREALGSVLTSWGRFDDLFSVLGDDAPEDTMEEVQP